MLDPCILGVYIMRKEESAAGAMPADNKTGAMPAENKMGTMPVGKLLFQISFPIIISMMIQALYNIVDSMYVSRINEQALTAVSLVFPMQMLMLSVAIGTNVGVNALLSRALGAKQFERVRSIAQQAVFLIIICYAIMACVLFFSAPGFIGMQTKDPLIYEYGITYMQICGVLCIGVFIQVCMERLLTATGKTVYTMICQIIGAIINIIMDPILIFGYGPFPEMGIAGAAAATIFGQIVAGIIGICFNLRVNKEIQLSMKGFRPDWGLIREIYKIGIPSIVLQSIGSIMTFGMNLVLMKYLANATAAAVFGVYFKINSIFFMPVFGLNNGLVPIVAFNYGARRRKRIEDVTRIATIVSFILLLAGTVAFWAIPETLLGIFNASDNMLAIGVPALRAISLSFPIAAYNIIRGSVMQSLGSAFNSMLVSLARQLFVLLPSALILAVIFRENGGLPQLWYSFVIAEVVALILTFFFYRRVYSQKVAPLPE